MLQITIDVSTLTAAQRSHVAQFITDYPMHESGQGNLPFDEVVATVQPFTFPEIEEDDPSPEVSFGPTLVPPPPAASVALDKDGLPWDERIHSGNKAFVADGTWRKRRGVDEGIIAQVEAELRAIMSIPAAVPVVPGFVIPLAPGFVAPTLADLDRMAEIPADEAPMMPMHNASTVSPPPPLPAVVPPPPPAAPVIPEPNAYLNLIQLVTDVVTKKKLTRTQVDECISSIDPSLNLQLLSKRPDLIPQIAANIRTLAA